MSRGPEEGHRFKSEVEKVNLLVHERAQQIQCYLFIETHCVQWSRHVGLIVLVLVLLNSSMNKSHVQNKLRVIKQMKNLPFGFWSKMVRGALGRPKYIHILATGLARKFMECPAWKVFILLGS